MLTEKGLLILYEDLRVLDLADRYRTFEYQLKAFKIADKYDILFTYSITNFPSSGDGLHRILHHGRLSRLSWTNPHPLLLSILYEKINKPVSKLLIVK